MSDAIEHADPLLKSGPSSPERRSNTLELPNDQSGATTANSGSSLWRALSAVASWVPPVLVVAGLGGLAWYGHHHDWKLPGVGDHSAASNSEWCDSHGVPEAECINCVEGLVEDSPELEFCKAHGVHGCVLDHPELAQTREPMEPAVADLERAGRALALRPRRENLSLSRLPGSRIQFASMAAVEKAGIAVEPVERREIVESLEASAEVLYDATQTAQVSPQADGIVKQVNVNVGDWVEAGQILAVVDSEKVGRLKAELLAALSDERLRQADVTRIEPLARRKVVPGKRLLESQTELQKASAAVDQYARAMTNLGLELELDRIRSMASGELETVVRQLGMRGIESVDDGGRNENLVAVLTPVSGRVVQRLCVVGQVVDRGTPMVVVSDTRKVWLDLRVAAEEASLAQLGQEVRFRPDGSASEYRGKTIWISSDVDRSTRTVRVRAELPNDDGQLRNESFGRGEIVLRDEPDAIIVPESAVQWDGENTLVFVRDSRFFEEGRPKFFIARSVRVGVSRDGFSEIIAGVLPGDVVAADGSDVLRAQLLKSNLGAGCTCGH